MRHRQRGAEPVEPSRRTTDGRTDGRTTEDGELGGPQSPAAERGLVMGPVRDPMRACLGSDMGPGTPGLCSLGNCHETRPRAGARVLGTGAGAVGPRQADAFRGGMEGWARWDVEGRLWRWTGRWLGALRKGLDATPAALPPRHRRRSQPSEAPPGPGSWLHAGSCRGTHLTTDVTDGHVDKDGGLLHSL